MEKKKLEIILDGKLTARVILKAGKTISVNISLKNKEFLYFHPEELEKIFEYPIESGIEKYKSIIQNKLANEFKNRKVEIKEY